MLPELVVHSLTALITIGATVLSVYLHWRGHVYTAFLVILLMAAADVANWAGTGVFDPAGFKRVVDGLAHAL